MDVEQYLASDRPQRLRIVRLIMGPSRKTGKWGYVVLLSDGRKRLISGKRAEIVRYHFERMEAERQRDIDKWEDDRWEQENRR